MSQELKQYVKDAMGRGADKEALKTTLLAAGWSADVIQKTLEQYVGVDGHGVPIPAPRMQAHQIARDIFVYFLILVTLSMNTSAVIGLYFNLINQWLPDAMHNYSYDGEVNWAIAMLIVAVPTYTGLNMWLGKHIVHHAEKRESLIRKLMIYFILGITAIASLVDLICTLTTFLGGDMTTRFLAKAIVVMILSILIFSYYFFEMRRDDAVVKGTEEDGVTATRKSRVPVILYGLGMLLVAGGLVGGFLETGGPAHQRMLMMDANRMDDLSAIQRDVTAYYDEHKKLPDSLDVLEHRPNSGQWEDPVTKQLYEYQKLDAQQFSLCANFETDTAKENDHTLNDTYREYRIGDLHGAGYQCFPLVKAKNPNDSHNAYFKPVSQ